MTPQLTDVDTADDGDRDDECPTCGRSDFESERGMKLHHAKTHGESLCYREVECDNCGSVFKRQKREVDRYEHHFCDDACKGEFYQEEMAGDNNPNYASVSVECENCGETVEKPPSLIEPHERSFCGMSCKTEWLRDQDDTWVKGSTNGMWNGGKAKMECEWCGRLFEVKKTTVGRREACSKSCSGKLRVERWGWVGENHPSWKGGVSEEQLDYGNSWGVIREKVLKRDGRECQGCGVDEDSIERSLHVHHIIPFRQFEDTEEANRLENLVSLCPTCHGRWERMAPLKPQVV